MIYILQLSITLQVNQTHTSWLTDGLSLLVIDWSNSEKRNKKLIERFFLNIFSKKEGKMYFYYIKLFDIIYSEQKKERFCL